jgi:hypothetical protein
MTFNDSTSDGLTLDSLYPSNFLKGSDLQGKTVNAKIREVKIEELGRDRERKPVMYFHGTDKGLVMNKTNATMIGNHYGQRIADWFGKDITLFATWVDFAGKSTLAIRVAVPGHKPENRQAFDPAAVTQAVEMSPADDGFEPDSDIPF